MKLKPVADQVIVITGASSGIGRATAIMAASRSATVVVAARGEAALGALADEIATSGGRAIVIPCDVSDPASIRHLADTVISRCGRIDTWINNAGVAIAGRLEDLPLDDARRLFDVNFWGVVNGSLAALPHLDKQGGALINLGSFTSDVAAPYMGMYSASKQAIKGYTDALRIEVAMDSSARLDHAHQASTDRDPGSSASAQPARSAGDDAPALLSAGGCRSNHPLRCRAFRQRPFRRRSRADWQYFGQILPSIADAGAASFAPRIFKTAQPPTRRPDNLYEPSMAAATYGDTHGHYPRPSTYTALRTRPRLVAAAVAAASGLWIAAKFSRATNAKRNSSSED